MRLTSSAKPVDFARDGTEVAIRAGAGPWPDGSIVTPLFDECVGPVLSPAMAQTADDDFAGLQRLHSRTRLSAWSDWCKRAGRPTDHEPGTEFEHLYFMLEAASAGLGVCVAPWPFVADDIKAGRQARRAARLRGQRQGLCRPASRPPAPQVVAVLRMAARRGRGFSNGALILAARIAKRKVRTTRTAAPGGLRP